MDRGSGKFNPRVQVAFPDKSLVILIPDRLSSTPFTSRSKPKRSHSLRYVLRNRATDDLYLAVTFSLYLKEDVNEDGSIKPEALERVGRPEEHQDDEKDDEHAFDEKKALDEARKHLSQENLETGGGKLPETSADDVD